MPPNETFADLLRQAGIDRPAWEGVQDQRPPRPVPRQMRPPAQRANDPRLAQSERDRARGRTASAGPDAMNLSEVLAQLLAEGSLSRGGPPQRSIGEITHANRAPPYRPPEMVVGPGGVTPQYFIPPEAMPPRGALRTPTDPNLRRGPMHSSPLQISPGPAPAQPNEPDAYALAPTNKFAPPDANEPDSDDLAWSQALERARATIRAETRAIGERLPRPGRPMLAQAFAASPGVPKLPRVIDRGYVNPTSPDGTGRWLTPDTAGRPKQYAKQGTLMRSEDLAQSTQDNSWNTRQPSARVDPQTGWPIDPLSGQPVAPQEWQRRQQEQERQAREDEQRARSGNQWGVDGDRLTFRRRF